MSLFSLFSLSLPSPCLNEGDFPNRTKKKKKKSVYFKSPPRPHPPPRSPINSLPRIPASPPNLPLRVATGSGQTPDSRALSFPSLAWPGHVLSHSVRLQPVERILGGFLKSGSVQAMRPGGPAYRFWSRYSGVKTPPLLVMG